MFEVKCTFNFKKLLFMVHKRMVMFLIACANVEGVTVQSFCEVLYICPWLFVKPHKYSLKPHPLYQVLLTAVQLAPYPTRWTILEQVSWMQFTSWRKCCKMRTKRRNTLLRWSGILTLVRSTKVLLSTLAQQRIEWEPFHFGG